MKTAEEYTNGIARWTNDDIKQVVINIVNEVIAERDKEWTQKIQTALDKTSNWNCKEVLTKLLEEKWNIYYLYFYT